MQNIEVVFHEYQEIINRNQDKEKEEMQYDRNDWMFSKIKDQLKPTICASCEADGDRRYGQCEECLSNQAFNKEYIETHKFITDTGLGDYHDGGCHPMFKAMKLHMPGEKPFLYYGIEIEVEFDRDWIEVFEYDEYDDCSEVNCEMEEILARAAKLSKGLFIYERDGSLENGVEFISRPLSYAAWTDPETVEDLKAMFAYLEEKHAFINQPDTNGMHIHISKKFFDYGECKRERRDLAYEDMDWLFQFFQEELEALGGRKYTQYCASKVEQIKGQYGLGTRSHRERKWNVELEVKGKMKKGGEMASGDHYTAVSISGPTIEGRIFNSTIDTTHVLANIEIMRNFAHAVRDGEIIGRSLNDILHTKDNLFLDTLIKRVREQKFKDGKEFNLDRVAEAEMEIK